MADIVLVQPRKAFSGAASGRFQAQGIKSVYCSKHSDGGSHKRADNYLE